MNWLDASVILVCLAGLLGAAFWLSQRQATVGDYYLAGRKIRWWESGLSTMATQMGAISFVSALAFAGFALINGWAASSTGRSLPPLFSE